MVRRGWKKILGGWKRHKTDMGKDMREYRTDDRRRGKRVRAWETESVRGNADNSQLFRQLFMVYYLYIYTRNPCYPYEKVKHCFSLRINFKASITTNSKECNRQHEFPGIVTGFTVFANCEAFSCCPSARYWTPTSTRHAVLLCWPWPLNLPVVEEEEEEEEQEEEKKLHSRINNVIFIH